MSIMNRVEVRVKLYADIWVDHVIGTILNVMRPVIVTWVTLEIMRKFAFQSAIVHLKH